MHLNWSSLGEVAAVSLGVTVAVVAVFALGVLGMSRATESRQRGGVGQRGGSRDQEKSRDRGESRHRGDVGSLMGAAQAGLCFAACAAVVAYGIYLIVPGFH